MGFTIDRIDHVVLNCRDVDATAAWYQRALGMIREGLGPDGRIALKFGNQKINLRPTNAPNWATGAVDAPGSLDLCHHARSRRRAPNGTANLCRRHQRTGASDRRAWTDDIHLLP
jgi:catechol 2,3-dioxygenase-like lactoylglutathione lyase family enzyme